MTSFPLAKQQLHVGHWLVTSRLQGIASLVDNRIRRVFPCKYAAQLALSHITYSMPRGYIRSKCTPIPPLSFKHTLRRHHLQAVLRTCGVLLLLARPPVALVAKVLLLRLLRVEAEELRRLGVVPPLPALAEPSLLWLLLRLLAGVPPLPALAELSLLRLLARLLLRGVPLLLHSTWLYEALR